MAPHLPHDINSEPLHLRRAQWWSLDEGSVLTVPVRKNQKSCSFLVRRSRIDLPCFCFPGTLLSYPFLHFLFFLRAIPALVLLLSSNFTPPNYIYFNKYSTSGRKHWLTGSAVLIRFLCPDPDPELNAHGVDVRSGAKEDMAARTLSSSKPFIKRIHHPSC